jgi:hypothetical protein
LRPGAAREGVCACYGGLTAGLDSRPPASYRGNSGEADGAKPENLDSGHQHDAWIAQKRQETFFANRRVWASSLKVDIDSRSDVISAFQRYGITPPAE